MTPAQQASRILRVLRGVGAASATCGFLAVHLQALGHDEAAALLQELAAEVGAVITVPLLSACGSRGRFLVERALAHYGDRLWDRLDAASVTALSSGHQLLRSLALLVVATDTAQELASITGGRFQSLRQPLTELREIFWNLTCARAFGQPDVGELMPMVLWNSACTRALALTWQPIRKAIETANAYL